MAQTVSQPLTRKRALWCFYDLSVSPTGFDFATFLALAEMERRKARCASFRVVIVPAEGEGFWDREPYQTAMKWARISKLLIPLSELMPNCEGVTVCNRRIEATALWDENRRALFPSGYTPERPIANAYQWADVIAALACGEALPSWRATDQARSQAAKWAEQYCGNRRLVTITLREASYFTHQNSDIPAWSAFVRELERETYCPVVVRDTEQATKPIPPSLDGLLCYPEASLDLHMRAALYEKAYLNMFSANGPMQLAWLNPAVSSLTFKLVNFADPRGCPIPIRSMGFEVGHQAAGFSNQHRIYWGDDSQANLQTGFDETVSYLDSGAPRSVNKESRFVTARRLRTTGRSAAARIYRHIALFGPREERAAAIAGLSLTALQAPVVPQEKSNLRLWLLELRHRLAFSAKLPRDSEAAIEIAQWNQYRLLTWRAEAMFRRVLASTPGQPEAQHGLGRLALDRENVHEAVEFLREAANAQPFLADSHYDYGEALIAAGNDPEALEQFTIAARNDPSHVLSHLRIDIEHHGMRTSEGKIWMMEPILLKSDRNGYACYYSHESFIAIPATVNGQSVTGLEKMTNLGTSAVAKLSRILAALLPLALGERVRYLLRKRQIQRRFPFLAHDTFVRESSIPALLEKIGMAHGSDGSK